MKFFLKYHFLPLLFGLSLAYLSLIFLVKSNVLSKNSSKEKTINGTTFLPNNFFESLIANDSLELQLLVSLREKQGITLFGSSELSSESQFIPFKTLPNSLNIRLNAFGHAFQQDLSIYCQLLALKKDLKNAKICIILSPGWFEEDGTNIEAFLEFVRPNFLNRIIKDETISQNDKKHIGKFLSKNYSKIKNPNAQINYFVNLYRYQSIPILNDYFEKRSKEINDVIYNFKTENVLKAEIKPIDFNFKTEKQQAIKNFKLISSSNKIQVCDTYFNEFIKKANGKIKKGHFDDLDKNSNQELKDFEKLIKLLKDSKCKASFVIQPLNPHHYENLESFNPLLEKIKQSLDREKIPYLNLFTSSKAKYIGGTLNDIMHFGDFGWLEMDEFLYKTYVK